MDVGHHGAAGVENLVDEEDFKLGKLRCESSTQLTDSLDGDDTNDECNGSEAADPSGPKPAVTKCLEKPAAFPCSEDKAFNLDTSNGEDPEAASKETLQRSKSIPPVSAMKGSREKQGKAGRQLSVTWAPDVYDPVPNSLCHTVKSSSSSNSKKKSRRDREKDKKNGKKGQKGSNSSSRGASSSKDKKQNRRKADKSYKLREEDEDVYAGTRGSLGYDVVASSDLCGSSFLKKNVTEFHYSVAEAL
ncbi:hypothetical protein LINGRAHAP2_LOCUS14282 [Linum grandiflorum]